MFDWFYELFGIFVFCLLMLFVFWFAFKENKRSLDERAKINVLLQQLINSLNVISQRLQVLSLKSDSSIPIVDEKKSCGSGCDCHD